MSYDQLYIITNALPYANDELHLGHMFSYVSSDIRARFLRSIKGLRVLHVCGSDMHGSAIMLSASRNHESSKVRSLRYEKLHREAFDKFQVQFDVYKSTNQQDNFTLVNEVFNYINCQGGISVATQHIPFDHDHQLFLPDRLVKYSCRICNSIVENYYCTSCKSKMRNQDNCKCFNLIPISVLTQKQIDYRAVQQYFLVIDPHVETSLSKWLDSIGSGFKSVFNEWRKNGLRDFAISRSYPYWGIDITSCKLDSPRAFYVWFDAPIGYLSCLLDSTTSSLEDLRVVWNSAHIEQFLGKDILSFHTIFWPTILHHIQFKKVNRLFVNGHLLLKENKLSKSSGPMLSALNFVRQWSADHFRYYVASKMHINNDVSLSSQEIVRVINDCLINKVLNIVNRIQGLIKRYDNVMLASIADRSLMVDLNLMISRVLDHYEDQCLNEVVATIESMADKCNAYISNNKPWIDSKASHRNMSDILQIFRIMMYYLSPIMPTLTSRLEQYYGCKNTGNVLASDTKLAKYNVVSTLINTDELEEFLNL